VVTTLQVSGMTCNGCVKHVTSALREVPGVTAVEVDLATGRAKVVGEAPVPALIAAVTEAGYEAE
jgi:copper chaperone